MFPTKEQLTENQIQELELESQSVYKGCKSISLFTRDEILKMADDNHIWLNAFSCINPTEKFLQDVGKMIIDKLNHCNTLDQFGLSKKIILTINKS